MRSPKYWGWIYRSCNLGVDDGVAQVAKTSTFQGKSQTTLPRPNQAHWAGEIESYNDKMVLIRWFKRPVKIIAKGKITWKRSRCKAASQGRLLTSSRRTRWAKRSGKAWKQEHTIHFWAEVYNHLSILGKHTTYGCMDFLNALAEIYKNK